MPQLDVGSLQRGQQQRQPVLARGAQGADAVVCEEPAAALEAFEYGLEYLHVDVAGVPKGLLHPGQQLAANPSPVQPQKPPPSVPPPSVVRRLCFGLPMRC
ncbi:hypothetical protein GCM10010211_80240 [Streptomyces albospinus]|uniref:Uncharacterized protein n=1 Tax=Streptomyces albospinus TaxID=285515 RepID=A0ABQ2VNY6_9ACTN|nr:hypothetical protein GCM10010211_80240 [Streptomyces albospinus]